MSVRKFLTLLGLWVLVCASLLEPLVIAPFFNAASTVELVLAAPAGMVSDLPSAGFAQATDSVSMDHFRLLCLLYIGIPLLAYFLKFQREDTE